jgi:hypothetical protein
MFLQGWERSLSVGTSKGWRDGRQRQRLIELSLGGAERKSKRKKGRKEASELVEPKKYP